MPIGDRGGEHVHHLQRSLGARGLGGVVGGHVQPWHEVPGRHEHHVRLAERRQHTADVVQEGGVGSDDEDAVVFDPPALRVEQVRNAVQRHHRLAGAGSALDHQHPGMVQPDDLVLFGLDGGDDVAHAVAAGCVDRREQSGIAAAPTLSVFGPSEELVGEGDHGAAAGVELTPAAHALRIRAGRGVEGLGRGRAPVGQQRLVVVVLVEDADPADVAAFAGQGVQPAEAQPVVRDAEPPHLLGQRAHLGVALHERAAVFHVDRAAQRRGVADLHPRAFRVEARVQLCHVLLFGLKFFFVFSSGHMPPNRRVRRLSLGPLPQVRDDCES